MIPRLKKTTVQHVYKRLIRTPKQKATEKKKRQKAKEEKQKHKDWMVETFGKARYNLSLWFGPWILYTANKSFYTAQPRLEVVPPPEETQPKVHKKQPKVVALPVKVCEFCGGQDIYLQGTKSVMPCPKCKRNANKVKVAK
jgi:hypothetical protein